MIECVIGEMKNLTGVPLMKFAHSLPCSHQCRHHWSTVVPPLLHRCSHNCSHHSSKVALRWRQACSRIPHPCFAQGFLAAGCNSGSFGGSFSWGATNSKDAYQSSISDNNFTLSQRDAKPICGRFWESSDMFDFVLTAMACRSQS